MIMNLSDEAVFEFATMCINPICCVMLKLSIKHYLALHNLVVGVWNLCWWQTPCGSLKNSTFIFSPWQIFLPFDRVLIYLFFWSSGFKLERFYEEWEEGEMVSTFRAVFVFVYHTWKASTYLCANICRGRRAKFDLQSLRQKTPINHMFKGL